MRNNVIYNNTSYSDSSGILSVSAEVFINNTIYNTFGIGVYDSAMVANNIVWSDGSQPLRFAAREPKYCVVRNYIGGGTNIITSDPKFVDPAAGDFHLRADSPCIDAGLTTEGVRADIKGVQRGLKGVQEQRGDGSGVDIGAFEYIPKPVAVWLPEGGPEEINAGGDLTVAWEMDTGSAGTAILLQLLDGQAKIADLGPFWNPAGADRSVIHLPHSIPTRDTYFIRGISSYNHTLSADTPQFNIINGDTSIPSIDWTAYR